jgi:Regulator of chromosome condensation (RCC1) repeat
VWSKLNEGATVARMRTPFALFASAFVSFGFVLACSSSSPVAGASSGMPAGSCSACPAPANGTATCDAAKTCTGFTCDANYGKCGNACCIAGDPGVVQVAPSTLALGDSHTCAITAVGGVKCWGYNRYGQLGNGTKAAENLVPLPVTGITSDAVSLSAGTSNTCALLKDKTVKCWGYDLVLDQTTDAAKKLTPEAVAGLSGVAQIASGNFHSCALLGTGSIKCWGYNKYGQLGNGGTSEVEAMPVDVKGITDAVRIGLGAFHSCAIVKDGTVKCWGRNNELQAGAAAVSDSVTTPTTVAGATGALTLSAGGAYSCALTNDGAKCWGSDASGLLGDGKNTGRANADAVTGLGKGTVSIGAGYIHACGVASNGSAKCWGVGLVGGPDSNTPLDVQGLSAGATEVVSGNKFSCARVATGLKCWGENTFGQLGDGTAENHAAAADVKGL